MSQHSRTLSGEQGDPLSALRDLASRREQLTAQLADLDRERSALVRRARNEGCGWQMIASALGVSRQAVHKKHGRR